MDQENSIMEFAGVMLHAGVTVDSIVKIMELVEENEACNDPDGTLWVPMSKLMVNDIKDAARMVNRAFENNPQFDPRRPEVANDG